MSVEPLTELGDESQFDSSTGGSWQRKTNCQPPREAVEPSDLPGGLPNRPISVEETKLRDEAVSIEDEGSPIPRQNSPALDLRDEHSHFDAYSLSVIEVVRAWRDWATSGVYNRGHLEIEEETSGEKAYIEPEHSYMESYVKKKYRKLRLFEEGFQREYDKSNLKTVLPALTSSHLNANGEYRCIADHMREVANGWDTARKQLPHILDDYEWFTAKVWEPHESGYGHLHPALFIVDPNDEIEAEDFRPFMRSYVENTPGASTEAHRNNPCDKHDNGGGWNDAVSDCDDCDTAVSVSDDIENLGSYITAYFDAGDGGPLESSPTEQVFYSTCWATQTRRFDLGHGAQSIVSDEEEFQEAKPDSEDRGEDASSLDNSGGNTEIEPSEEWVFNHLCIVKSSDDRDLHDNVDGGGVSTTTIDARDGFDPPRKVS